MKRQTDESAENRGILGSEVVKVDVPPEARVIVREIEQTITDASGFYDRIDDADATRFCEWDGQSEDGRKRAEALGRDAFPWEGASDTRVRLADATAAERVKVQKQAFFRAKIQAAGREATDLPRSRAVTTLLQWVRDTLMADHLRSEVDFLGNFKESYGSALMRVGWERTMMAENKTTTMAEMIDGAIAAGIDQAQQTGGGQSDAQAVAAANVEQVKALVLDEANEDQAVAMIVEMTPGVKAKRARKIIRELREKGTSTYPVPFVASNRPVVRALIPFVDVFFPLDTCNIQKARWIAEIETVTEAELRARAEGEGYDMDWVDEVCEKKGVFLTDAFLTVGRSRGVNGPGRLGGPSAAKDKMIQIVHVHWTSMDEDGSEARWTTCVHKDVEGAGYHMRCPFKHGQYPFVTFRTESILRPVVEARGVPEIVKPHQDDIKVQRDARTDRTTIATVPPLLVPGHRAGGKVTVGPGVQIPERRQGEHRWMEPPRYDQGSIEVEESIRRDVDGYFGRQTEKTPAPIAQIHQQDLVDDFLGGMREVFGQVFGLMQQFMDPVTVAKVTGFSAPLLEIDRESIAGQWDISIEFDVREFDTEYLASKLKLISEIVIPLDTEGVVQRGTLAGYLMGAVDPSLAQHVMRSVDDASTNEANDEMNAVVQMAAGIEPVMKEGGQNHALRLNVLKDTVMKSPTLSQRMQGDELFRALVENRAKHHQFQVEQEQNKQIGRVGAKRVMG
jgi:hypothetical protein